MNCRLAKSSVMAVRTGATPPSRSFIVSKGRHPSWLSATAWLGFAALNLDVKGPDPSDYLFPLILFTGVLLAHLNIRDAARPRSMAFLLLAFLSCFASSSLFGYDTTYVGYIASNLSFCVFTKLYIRSHREAKVFFSALGVGGLLCGALGAASVLGYWTPPDIFLSSERHDRFFALKGDPNVLGILTAMLLMWLLDELLHPKLWRGARLLKTAVILLALLQLASTFSRAGILFFIVALACYLALSIPIVRVQFVFRIGLLLMLTSAVAIITLRSLPSLEFGQVMRERLLLESNEGNRFEHLRAGLELVVANPFGVGPGRTKLLLGDDQNPFAAHNTAVEVIADNGWIAGVVMLLAYGLLVARALIKSAGSEMSRYAVSHRLVASLLVGLAASACFHSMAYINICWIPPSLAWATLWAPPGRSVAHQCGALMAPRQVALKPVKGAAFTL